jgi:hypothetical protein
VISDAHFDSLPPDQQGQYARVRKGPDGGSEWRSRDQLGTDPVASSATPADGTVPTVEGDTLRLGDLELTAEEARGLLTAKADADLRKASLPATPADYKAELPLDFQAPAGIEIKINEADPLLADARRWAHAKGWDQATFSEMVALYAGAQAREQATFAAAHAAEVAKMGANGSQRVTAIESFLRGHVGDDLAKGMRAMLVTADIVKGFEKLAAKFSSQGAANFSQSHREPREVDGRVSSEQYDRMTPAQRLDYARSFDQRQFTDAHGNPR